MIVADKFKEHFAPGHFSRVDTEHPLDIYIGVDDQCHYALEFRGEFVPQTVKSSNSIGIKQYQTSNFSGIIFSLNEQDMLDNFCVFCDDIITSTATTTDAMCGYKLVINRFYAWKKMFQTKSKIMDESRIMGLIGELLFLRDYMIPTYGESTALRAWSGQELTHKDFSEILKKLDSDEHKDIFINKLVDSGFSFEAIYNEYVYEVSDAERYLVDASFPRLVTDDVNEAIVKVQYELLLSYVQQYKIEWHYGN